MDAFVVLILFLCFVWAVAGPLVSTWIEERLELFMLALGIVAVTASWRWSEAALFEAILRPMKLCGALLIGSLVFSFSHDSIRSAVRRAAERFGLRPAVGGAVCLLGFSAGAVTMEIAVLALVELLQALRLDRQSEQRAAVLGCFAVGMGGGLTPIGGPIPAIAMAKLASAAYPVDARYFFALIGPWAVPSILTAGLLAGMSISPRGEEREAYEEDPLSLWNVLLLTGRMYVFIAGLVLLGEGLIPFIDRFLLSAPPAALYWLNGVSAVIDGGTLASLELSPSMSQNQIRYLMMGVLIPGAALITGNAPNLVAARRLGIASADWAAVGVPLSALMMLFYFLSLVLWAP